MRFIVGETSVNWKDGKRPPDSDGLLIHQKFEEMINVNDRRGYFLKSWKLTQIMCRDNEMLETIVAVFEARRDETRGPLPS